MPRICHDPQGIVDFHLMICKSWDLLVSYRTNVNRSWWVKPSEQPFIQPKVYAISGSSSFSGAGFTAVHGYQQLPPGIWGFGFSCPLVHQSLLQEWTVLKLTLEATIMDMATMCNEHGVDINHCMHTMEAVNVSPGQQVIGGSTVLAGLEWW